VTDGGESGWTTMPGGRRGETGPLPRVAPGRVVGLGALCELGPPRPDPREQSFLVSEFAVLDDGRRVTLHGERGFTAAVRSTGPDDPGDLRHHETIESLTADVLTVVLPDDDDDPEAHPWDWLAGLARARGLDVGPDDLRSLPYEVCLTERVHRWLGAGPGVDS
jgi:hypothetical protein